MKKLLAIFILTVAIGLMASPKNLWAPRGGCEGCSIDDIRKCETLINSERFVIQGKTNPEGALRITNALRNKVADIIDALSSINAKSTRADFQAFHEAREDFELLVAAIDKQKDQGKWSLDESTDAILDACDTMLNPDN